MARAASSASELFEHLMPTRVASVASSLLLERLARQGAHTPSFSATKSVEFPSPLSQGSALILATALAEAKRARLSVPKSPTVLNSMECVAVRAHEQRSRMPLPDWHRYRNITGSGTPQLGRNPRPALFG